MASADILRAGLFRFVPTNNQTAVSRSRLALGATIRGKNDSAFALTTSGQQK
jgi:hypothetical protein